MSGHEPHGKPVVRRSIEALRVGRETVVLTRHRAVLEAPDAKKPVFLLLNAGPAPRSGNSDLSVRIADACAAKGLATVRMDATGLGDSTGASWARIEDFRVASQESDLDALVASVASRLLERSDVSGVLLGGLCAGGTLAIRAGARLGASCDGLVLLEPDFLAASGDRRPGSGARRVRARASRGLRAVARRTRRFAGLAPLARLLELGGEFCAPAAMHGRILADWRRVLERRPPVLLVVGQGLDSARVVRGVLRSSRVAARHADIIEVPETNHILTAGDAVRALPEQIAEWACRALHGFETRAGAAGALVPPTP